MSKDVLDAMPGLFTTKRVRVAAEKTIREIVAHATIIDVTTQKSMQLVSMDDEMRISEVSFMARPMVMKPTLVVVTSTEYGHATIGSIEVDASDELEGTRYTTTLPSSLIQIEGVQYDHPTGRVLVSLLMKPRQATLDDLNSPDTALGRLLRYSMMQHIVSAPPSRTNFDDASARVESLKRRIASARQQ